MYIQNRKFHNLQILKSALFEPFYGFPVINPLSYDTDRIDDSFSLIGFNQVKRNIPEHSILHFYLDDYQFERMWNFPSRYLNYCKSFDYVITPDFSVYVNIPRSLQIFNHYRNNALAWYLQYNGVNIIPCVQWGDCLSYDYSFAGLPRHSVISISSQGWLKSDFSTMMFIRGFDECIKRLAPQKIVFYGNFLPELYDLTDADFVFYKPFIRSRFAS